MVAFFPDKQFFFEQLVPFYFPDKQFAVVAA
jgi:hypothetical protein